MAGGNYDKFKTRIEGLERDRSMTRKGVKPRFVAVPKTPEVTQSIIDAAAASRVPQYAIKNLIVIGVLDPDLRGEHDRHTIENVLPRLVKNKVWLSASLPKLGNTTMQLEFVKSLKEVNPFANALRKFMETKYDKGESLNIRSIVKEFRMRGGNFASHAKQKSDEDLMEQIAKIKNKIFSAAARNDRKEAENNGDLESKIEFLRKQLISCGEKVSPAQGTHLQLAVSQERVTTYNQRTIIGKLKQLGQLQPSLLTEKKRELRDLSTIALQAMAFHCPGYTVSDTEWMVQRYGERTIAILNAQSAGRAAAGEEKCTFLDQVLLKIWFVRKVAAECNLDLTNPSRVTIEVLHSRLTQLGANEEDLLAQVTLLLEGLPNMAQEALDWTMKWVEAQDQIPF